MTDPVTGPTPGSLEWAVADLAARMQRLEDSVNESAAVQLGFRDETREWWRETDGLLRHLELRSQAQIESARRERDGIEDLRAALDGFRMSPGYDALWDETEPLVTIRIASYNRTRELVETALASVLQQTYQRLEIVVVNDGPNPATRAALEGLGDPRVRYFELPERAAYPAHQHLRWMVAGSPAMNEAARRAEGAWIAPLDDDDEFAADHIERLLELARAERAELVYGALIQRDRTEGVDRVIFSDPPAAGGFSFQSTLYLSGLRFFEYDTESWRVDEPGDWNLARRMVAAGVRMSSTRDVHAFMNMVRFDKRDDA
ncbi:glycosyltransferase family 2 protein [Microbacterium testaceum]|uniref:glycosyltransferase family 2 protein n=1 Tax=Microbacterium testaceum TaxID=2033 RepID=UPI001248980B|nr:glycosyltransferase family 2 protein [Microbacterium testaceum]